MGFFRDFPSLGKATFPSWYEPVGDVFEQTGGGTHAGGAPLADAGTELPKPGKVPGGSAQGGVEMIHEHYQQDSF